MHVPPDGPEKPRNDGPAFAAEPPVLRDAIPTIGQRLSSRGLLGQGPDDPLGQGQSTLRERLMLRKDRFLSELEYIEQTLKLCAPLLDMKTRDILALLEER